SGSAYNQTPRNGIDPPPMQPGSVGDLCGGATLAGAIAAALFRRERTGKGAVIDHSLYLIGIYIMSQSIIAASMGGEGPGRAPKRTEAPDPLGNWYKTKDERWLLMMLLYPQWWEDFARHIGKEEWITDPRFATDAARGVNNLEMIRELDAVFATKTLAEWEEQFSTLQGVWSPAKSPAEVVNDPQALENGYVTRVDMANGDHYMAGAGPAQFDRRPVGALKAAPGHGEHTDAVLRELGITDDQIAGMKAAGLIV
ncbi:MAG: CoA transferase, partial [Acidimicrobiia bacterium]